MSQMINTLHVILREALNAILQSTAMRENWEDGDVALSYWGGQFDTGDSIRIRSRDSSDRS
jgi:hypothetical protein